MWNKLFTIIAICIFLIGCGKADTSPVAVEIDGIKVTVDEFEEAYQDSPYLGVDSPESRKEFLDNLIMRKIILREAERLKLNEDPEFLKSVQLFWQQSLLKLMLARESRQLSANLRISDSEIRGYYNKHREADFKDKDLADVYSEIKNFLLQEKKQRAMSEWLNSLKNKTHVKVNYKLLNIEK